MISHRERMLARLAGQETDRPPVALWRHFPVDDQSPETLAAAQLAFQDLYDFDFVKVTPASSFSVRDWGVEDVWDPNTEGTRTYTRRVITHPRDWERLPVVHSNSPHLQAQLRCLRLMRSKLDISTPIIQTIFNPLSQAKHLAGEETLLAHLRRHPDAVAAGLRTIAESTREFIGAAIETGMDGVFFAVQHAQAGLLSPAEFSRFGHDLDLDVLRAAAGLWCNLLHVHGRDIYFDAVSDYSTAIINWHDRETAPTLAEAAPIWSGTLCGGLGRDTLVAGTPGEIAGQASEALALTGGHLVLSTGCVVPIVAPHGNLVAARRAVESAN